MIYWMLSLQYLRSSLGVALFLIRDFECCNNRPRVSVSQGKQCIGKDLLLCPSRWIEPCCLDAG